MSGFHINIITNSKGSGDWIIVECEGEQIYAGHTLGTRHLMDILQMTNGWEFLSYYELDDEQIQNWPIEVEPTEKVRF